MISRAMFVLERSTVTLWNNLEHSTANLSFAEGGGRYEDRITFSVSVTQFQTFPELSYSL